MKNFKVKSVEDGKTYWISRAMATRSEVIIHDDDGKCFIVVNKRGSGVADCVGMWNIPCGYLEFDVTTKENATKEFIEEIGSYIPPYKWTLVDIEDDPSMNHQNVTFVYQVHLTRESFNESLTKGFEMNCVAEIDEVDAIEVMPLDINEICAKTWAFNHKERLLAIVDEVSKIREFDPTQN
jgi:8-oxo-dGTP pyrophosphatase MutT (NUDIX family)